MNTRPLEPEFKSGDRVAVIAVHGVADQDPGDTARAIAALLVNAAPHGVEYENAKIGEFVISVEPIDALRANRSGRTGAAAGAPAAVVQKPSTRKKIRQSLGSDFLRPDWETPGTVSTTARPALQRPKLPDQGTRFTDYLLFKAGRNGATPEPYESTRIRMARQTGGSVPQQIDVFEMYWADLSRLSGKVPRIVSELFTLVFRLSRLGRDAVDYNLHPGPGANAEQLRCWRQLSWLQTGLDVAFMTVLVNLFIQLLVVGLFCIVVQACRGHEGAVADGLIAALTVIPAWWFLYRVQGAGSRLAVVMLALLAAAALMTVAPAFVVCAGVLGVLGLALDIGLRIGDARFPGTRASGLLFLAGTVGLIVGHGWLAAPDLLGRSIDDWTVAGMRATEDILALIVVWWLVVPIVMIAWMIAGWRAAHKDPLAAQSVATGRLGLFVSITAFLTFTMAIWAMLTTVTESAAAHIQYMPYIFKKGEEAIPGNEFFHGRYVGSTMTFPLVAGLLLVLLLYVALMALPSVLAEKKIRLGTEVDLGRWLSGGFRNLDRLIAIVVASAVMIGLVTGVLQVMTRVSMPIPAQLSAFLKQIGDLSTNTLEPLVLGTATLAATVTAFGAVVSRVFPNLRLPLDVVLDVDNHFREFPRKAIPRARIFGRYVALLEKLVADEYDRIVIVAHSQGSVISAEVLRYIKARAVAVAAAGGDTENAAPGGHDRIARLWGGLENKVDLLTAGNPLRQLYAARFPVLYSWVCTSTGYAQGPDPTDIGVNRWINLYTTGDYVGRWLWREEGENNDELYVHTQRCDCNSSTAFDVCLGAGAHTHYFDADQVTVASYVDCLIGNGVRTSTSLRSCEHCAVEDGGPT